MGAIYDVFTVAEGEQIFLAVVSDTQWKIFCEAIGFHDWADDVQLRSNNDRVKARHWLIPALRERLAARSAAELASIFERNGLPFAPIAAPETLFADPHLRQTGGLAPMSLPDGRETQVPLLPISLGGRRLGVRSDPPKIGEHNDELLRELGVTIGTALGNCQ